MKTFKSVLFSFIILGMATSSWAHSGQSSNDTYREVTTGKTSLAEVDAITNKSIDEKQVRAIQLINIVGSFANDRLSKEIDKENADYAYNGFIARFQGIREDREALGRKEVVSDNKSLASYSQRLDRLTADIQNFLK